MITLRRLAIFTAGALLSFLLFMSVTSFAVSSTVGSPAYVKKWFMQSNVYKNIVGETIKLADIQTALEPTGTSKNDILQLTPIIEKTLTPVVLQTNTETVVDAMGKWLAGDTKNPDFSISIAPLRTEIINNTADYLYARVQALPTCQQIDTSNYDPLTATCKPNVAINKQSFIDNATTFANNLPFLKYDNLTYQSFTQNTNPYWDGNLPQAAPNAYKWLKLSPYIFGLLAILAAVVLVVLKKDHASAWRAVGHTLLITGLFLVIASLLTKALLGKPLGFIGSSSDAQKDFAQNIAVPVMQYLSLTISNISLYFGVGFIVVSAVCYVISKFILRRKLLDQSDQKLKIDADEPQKDIVETKMVDNEEKVK